MNKLISPTQTAFVKGRQISDGIYITSEIYHSLKSAKSKGLILKIDFAKAFDCINWEFLFHVLEIMHFDVKWIKWIRNLFDSSRVSILVNGSPTEEFHPTRGLRQGDPLSPLLFNLIGEALSCLINAAHDKGLFEGVTIAGCPDKITHLQFVVDVILFLRNDTHSVHGIKATLQVFELISGLKINYRKQAIRVQRKSRAAPTLIRILRLFHLFRPYILLRRSYRAVPKKIGFLEASRAQNCF